MNKRFMGLFLALILGFASVTEAISIGYTGKVASANVTGLTIDTNIQAYDADLSAIGGLTSAANKLPYFTGSGTASVADFTSNGRILVAQSSTANIKTSLSLNNVENTAISTWAGSTNLTTLGTISTGVWSGTAVGVTKGGTGTTTQFTANSVVFAGGSGVYSQDASNLVWDDSNNRLGIGLTNPSQPLSIASTTSGLICSIQRTTDTNWIAYGIKNESGTAIGYFGAATPSGGGILVSGPSNACAIITDGKVPIVISPDGTMGNGMIVSANGNIGIGTSTPSYKLQVSTDSAGKPGVGGLWTVVSDERVKENITDLDDGISILSKLRVRKFTYKPEAAKQFEVSPTENQYGFIAQEYETVFPRSVSVHGDIKLGDELIENVKQVNTGQTSALVIRAIQQLSEEIILLKLKLTSLEGQNVGKPL